VNVAWPTDRGHLYVSGATQNRINFRLEANDAIAAAAAVMANGRLLVSSIDGFVYCLQESNGVVLWRFSSGEPILESPVVFGDTVYAVTSDGNLFAIDSDLGQERWSTSGVFKVAGASPTRLYCLTRIGGLMVIDRQTGSHLGGLTTNSLDLPFTNKETDRIVLASRRGAIQCLREIQQEFPLIYVGLTKQEEATPKTPRKPAKPALDAPAEPAADPFGVGAPAAATPEAKPADDTEKKSDDPFAP
jgi:hypothetical protein